MQNGSFRSLCVVNEMQSLAPEEYRSYRDYAMRFRAQELGEEGTVALVERYRSMSEEAGVTLTQEEAMDEIAADFTMRMIEDGGLFEDFARENRSEAGKLLDALKAFIAKVKALFRSKEARDKAAREAYGTDVATLEECVARWQKAYTAAGKAAQNAKTAAGEGSGEGRYQIKKIDGRLMTVIDTQNDTRDFKAAEAYLKTLVNTDHPFSTILMDAQPVYVGKDLPGEYRSSEYTKSMLSKLRDVKMQAATNLDEMLLLAENGEWRENVKPKHAKDAQNGWYRYDAEFAVPILNAKKAVDHYTVYGGTLLIRNDADGKSYLYDLLDIEKKKVISAASFSAETHSEVLPPKPSTNSISTSDGNVNAKFSLKGMYAWSDDGKGECTSGADHVGIVTKVSGTTFWVTEGNYSDSVKTRTMQVNGRYIRGFGLPDYAGKATGAASSMPEIADVFVSPKLRQLKKGVKDGGDVKAVQTLLIVGGYSCGTQGADGSFGNSTDAAVRKYQSDHGLTADGVVGFVTWGRLLGA